MTLSFQELQHEMFSLHSQGRYADALELVLRGLKEHSGYRARMNFWAACLECRLDRPAEALSRLERLVSEGEWVSPVRLANDPDLAPLQGQDAFTRVIEACEARRARDQENLRPQLLIEAPRRTSGRLPPLVMALHMMGGSAAESRHYWQPVTDSGILLALPQGTELMGPGEYGWASSVVDQIEAHMLTVGKRFAFDQERVIFAGASRGAAHSVELALRGEPRPVRGFIAIVGAPSAERLEPYLERAREAGIRGVFLSGDEDFALPRVTEAYESLRQAGLQVRLEVLPGLGHLYPGDLAERLETYLPYVLGTEG